MMAARPRGSTSVGAPPAVLPTALFALLLLLLLPRPARSDPGEFTHLRDPIVRWTADLTLSMEVDAFSSGNEVTLSPDGGTMLYATTLTGALISRETNATNYRGRPGEWHRYQTPGNGEEWSTFCRTGIGFSLPDIARPYFVYAVEDVPPVLSPADIKPSSRIFAFNHPYTPGDDPRWISPSIEGKVSGTPIVSSDGLFVYVNHNVNSTRIIDSSTTGVFTIFQSGSKSSLILESMTTYGIAPGPYGPLAIARRPLAGKYQGGDLNRNDLLVWGHLHYSDALDNWERGFLNLFQFSTNFDMQDASRENVRTLQLVSWSVRHRALLSSTGLEMWIGASRSEVRGWWDPQVNFNRRSDWSLNADEVQRDETRQLKTLPAWGAPVLSPDEQTVYVTTTSNAVYAVSALTGKILWEDLEMPSLIKTEMKLSPAGDRLYIFMANGLVLCKRTGDGENQWRYMSKLTGGEADMAVSPDGTTLYFAGNEGTTGRYIYALGVGDYETAEPTLTPTLAPAAKPTLSPTTATPLPTARPTTGTPTSSPTSMPTSKAPYTLPPTAGPTASPTATPTAPPTAGPTAPPTSVPSGTPTSPPTVSPTLKPTPEPTDSIQVAGAAASSAALTKGRQSVMTRVLATIAAVAALVELAWI